MSGFRFLHLLLALVLSLVLATFCFQRRKAVKNTLLLCAAVALLLSWIEVRLLRTGPALGPAHLPLIFRSSSAHLPLIVDIAF